ncbi:unnamed protein product [Closterium sp. NIES-64]|nr:unnamed protein product [Closterium sp. NIES-64]
MVPTPFFDGGVGQTHDMEAEHGESSPEEGVGDARGDDPKLLELKRLLNSPATPPQAVGHATAVAHRGRVNGGLYTNRLKKERDHLNNTNGGAPGPVPAAQPTRVGVHDQRKDTSRGAAYSGHGAGAAEGFQARGVKRERNVPQMTLIIDYDPERSREGLIRGMASPDEIVVSMRTEYLSKSEPTSTNGTNPGFRVFLLSRLHLHAMAAICA